MAVAGDALDDESSRLRHVAGSNRPFDVPFDGVDEHGPEAGARDGL
jgi:hypothetical protein